jgi:hypothetical protein
MRRVTSKMPEGETVAIKFLLAAGRAELLRDGSPHVGHVDDSR